MILKNKRITLTLFIIFLIIVSSLLMLACQATPEKSIEKSIVVKKDNAEEVIFDTGKNGVKNYELMHPERVSKKINVSDNYSVVIDADVSVPKVDKHLKIYYLIG